MRKTMRSPHQHKQYVYLGKVVLKFIVHYKGGVWIMLIKNFVLPFQKFVSFFTKEMPYEKKTNEAKRELTPLGRKLFWDARRKTILRAQQGKLNR
ncbi:MAG: hypothetical protein COW60_00195 [Candidatus Yonathbacteria bacterium CG17_big_fil_post_rev_8_21_14_2_50_43_9]|nr:MAG: hypothetical protein COW60_00195 [Candidatus Yonathbacteria bacterium CG17_big_fil_post_rev_8_21_14_2_50_43_9]